MRKVSEEGALRQMDIKLSAIRNSVKPIVAVVRGGAVGIAFTTLSLVDFIYCSPDAVFKAPFMASC